MSSLRVVCFSDSHNQHDSLVLPEGDVLVCAGDVTTSGSLAQMLAFLQWFKMQPYRYKVLVAGNHDRCLYHDPGIIQTLMVGIEYLQDREVLIEGRRFYGTPWCPKFQDWAFMVEAKSERLKRLREAIPAGLDMLVCHSPPYGILDQTDSGDFAGCRFLTEVLPSVRPKHTVFGHIHEAYGRLSMPFGECHNVAVLDERYRLTNTPTVIDL